MKEFQLEPFFIKNPVNLLLNWKVTRYLVLLTLIAAVAGLIAAGNYGSATTGLIMDLLQVACFVTLGIVHNRLLETRPAFTHLAGKERFYLTIVSTFLIYGTLLLLYFLLHSDRQPMALAGSAAFLLPYMVIQAWNYFLLIPATSAYVWNNYHRSNENFEIVYLNTILLNFRLSDKHLDKEESVYLISTPFNLELGKVFNSFLNREIYNGNLKIESISKDGQPFAWQFFHVRFGGLYKKLLDPRKTIYNNGNIRKSSTIVAKRMEPA